MQVTIAGIIECIKSQCRTSNEPLILCPAFGGRRVSIFFWRALYGLLPFAACTILFFYRMRGLVLFRGQRRLPLSGLELGAVGVIFVWLVANWAIVHWRLWPDLSH